MFISKPCSYLTSISEYIYRVDFYIYMQILLLDRFENVLVYFLYVSKFGNFLSYLIWVDIFKHYCFDKIFLMKFHHSSVYFCYLKCRTSVFG